MGQLSDKPHGIGKEDFAPVLHFVAPGGGVQGVKQPVVGMNACAGQRVEQGGFPRVGISNQSNEGRFPLASFPALGGSGLLDVFNLLFQPGDALADMPAVGFQLGFARASGANGAAAAARRLPDQVGPHPGKPRQQILILRQLHLQLALSGFGSVRKNIQNQAVSIHHPAFHNIFQSSGLRGGNFVVKYQQLQLVLPHKLGDLLGLALADKGMGVWGVSILCGGKNTLAACGFQQLLQLRHGIRVGIIKPGQAGAIQPH